MSAAGVPRKRTRAIVTAVVFVVLAVGVGIGVWALVTASGGHAASGPPSASPTPEPTPAGYLYTSAEYGYSVEFPSQPVEQSKTVPAGDAQIAITSAVWDGGSQSLISNGAAYPRELVTDVTTMLKSSLDGAVANVPGAQLVSSDPIQLAGIPAVRADISVPGGTIRIVIAIDGATQYQLVATNTDQPTADGFFASFRPA